ncbi:MAG TPA: amidase [Terriglobia bacterium]|nr:amidase [Terriglobia bacterium]
MSLENLTMTEAVSEIRSGALSPLEYAQALLARVDAVEGRVQAWTTIDREAVLSEARLMEAEARKKHFRGPLHGIPVGIKDIFYTKNLRTTMGSTAFADFVPAYDASVVKKLKHAGALIMGKCVTTILVFLDPGPTRNAWNTNHTPGGSSSGSAAAVGARMCPVSIGSQTVGSVGRPAAYNGVVSIMPTQSRVDMTGAFPLAWSLDHVGVFSRSAADVEVLLSSLSEAPLPSRSGPSHHKFRIGLASDFFFEKADIESQGKIEELAGRLSGSGFQVTVADLPSIFGMHPAILRTIVRSEAASTHQQLIRTNPEAYGPKLRDLVQLGELIDASTYLRARRIRREYQRQMMRLFEHVDVVLTPAAPGPAPAGIGATGDPVMQAPWTLADFPTMTLPLAVASNGLPLGIQLSAAPLHEGMLLEAAKAIEEVIGFRAQPNL